MKDQSRLKTLREERNLTQEDLAKGLNITRQNISNWELDLSCIKLDTAIKIADYLDISLDYLAGREFKKTYKQTLVELLKNVDVDKLVDFLIKQQKKN